MSSLNTSTRDLRRVVIGSVWARLLAIAGAVASPATSFAQQQCPTGQQACMTQKATGLVRLIQVPGNSGALHSGIFMRPGYYYRMTAVGSIRVGVIGETGTPPDGWVPQGPAGPGFPDPDSYTFALLYRVGPAGLWQLLGSGQAVAKLGPRDAPGSELIFGINDNNLSDNSGLFIVTLTEYAPAPSCCNVVPPGGGAVILYSSPASSSSSTKSSNTSHPPCAGKSPNGQYQSFQFQMVCAGNIQRQIPVEACTRADAVQQAQAFAREDMCILTGN